jgi:general stress protein YciG
MNDNKRGFGSMDEQKQREASGKGGKASQGGQQQNAGGKDMQDKSAGSRGGSHEQHVHAGEQSHKHR